MFTEEKISVIFGNIEEIFKFSTQFLETLESAYCKEQPHQSELGKCFLTHVSQNYISLLWQDIDSMMVLLVILRCLNLSYLIKCPATYLYCYGLFSTSVYANQSSALSMCTYILSLCGQTLNMFESFLCHLLNSRVTQN